MLNEEGEGPTDLVPNIAKMEKVDVFYRHRGISQSSSTHRKSHDLGAFSPTEGALGALRASGSKGHELEFPFSNPQRLTC